MLAPLRARVAAGGVFARAFGSTQSAAPVRATEEATRQQASRLPPALQAWLATPGFTVSRHAYRSRDAFQRPRGERLGTMQRYLQQGGNLLLVDAHDAAERVAEPVEDQTPNEGTAIRLAAAEAGVDPAGVVVAAEIDPCGVVDPPLALDAPPTDTADAATSGHEAASMLAPGIDAVCRLAERDGVDLLVLRCPHAGFASTEAQSAFLRPLLDSAVDLIAAGRAHAWTLASPAGLTFSDAESPAPGALRMDQALALAGDHGLCASLAGLHAPLNLAERTVFRDVARSDLDVPVLTGGDRAIEVQALGDVSPLHYLSACGLALFAERPMLAVGPDVHPIRFQVPPHHPDMRLHFRVHGALSQLMGLEDRLHTHAALANSKWEQRVRDPSSLRWGAILGQNLHQFQSLHEWERVRELRIMPAVIEALQGLVNEEKEGSELMIWCQHYKAMTALALGAITRLMERVDANHCTAVHDRIAAAAAGSGAAALPLPVLATAAVLEAGRNLPLLAATGEAAPVEELGALRKAMEKSTCAGVVERLDEAGFTLPRREDTWTDPFAQDPPPEEGAGENGAAPGQRPAE